MPDDPWFEEMDFVLKLWLYESWCKDQEEKNNFARSYVILNGSFTNAEMARKMIKQDNPDFESSEEDFDKTSKEMLKKNRQEIKSRRQRRRIERNNY